MSTRPRWAALQRCCAEAASVFGADAYRHVAVRVSLCLLWSGAAEGRRHGWTQGWLLAGKRGKTAARDKLRKTETLTADYPLSTAGTGVPLLHNPGTGLALSRAFS